MESTFWLFWHSDRQFLFINSCHSQVSWKIKYRAQQTTWPPSPFWKCAWMRFCMTTLKTSVWTPSSRPKHQANLLPESLPIARTRRGRPQKSQQSGAGKNVMTMSALNTLYETKSLIKLYQRLHMNHPIIPNHVFGPSKQTGISGNLRFHYSSVKKVRPVSEVQTMDFQNMGNITAAPRLSTAALINSCQEGKRSFFFWLCEVYSFSSSRFWNLQIHSNCAETISKQTLYNSSWRHCCPMGLWLLIQMVTFSNSTTLARLSFVRQNYIFGMSHLWVWTGLVPSQNIWKNFGKTHGDQYITASIPKYSEIFFCGSYTRNDLASWCWSRKCHTNTSSSRDPKRCTTSVVPWKVWNELPHWGPSKHCVLLWYYYDLFCTYVFGICQSPQHSTGILSCKDKGAHVAQTETNWWNSPQ